jgi:LysR family nitrogen assimilation transcriptional regulator
MKALNGRAELGISPATFGARIAGRPLELRELRYFHAVACTGNFGRAARELNVSQPAVTTQVQKLERQLGMQLLIRHGRGVTLTQAGSCLIERLNTIIGLLNAPLVEASEPEKTKGLITLALPSETAPLLFPPFFEACRTRWPNLTVAVQEGSSASLEEWVLQRRVDIAVLQDPAALHQLDVEPVLTEQLGLVSDIRVIPLERMSSIRVRQLAGVKLILPHQRHWIRRLAESAASRRGIALEQVQQADGVPLIKEMVRKGFGHTILPYAAVRDEVARGTLSFVPICHDTLFTVHAIACHNGTVPDPLVRAVRSLLRDVMSNMVRNGAWAGATAIMASPRATETARTPILEISSL